MYSIPEMQEELKQLEELTKDGKERQAAMADLIRRSEERIQQLRLGIGLWRLRDDATRDDAEGVAARAKLAQIEKFVEQYGEASPDADPDVGFAIAVDDNCNIRVLGATSISAIKALGGRTVLEMMMAGGIQ